MAVYKCFEEIVRPTVEDSVEDEDIKKPIKEIFNSDLSTQESVVMEKDTTVKDKIVKDEGHDKGEGKEEISHKNKKLFSDLKSKDLTETCAFLNEGSKLSGNIPKTFYINAETSSTPNKPSSFCDNCYRAFDCGISEHWSMRFFLDETNVLSCDGCQTFFKPSAVVYMHVLQEHTPSLAAKPKSSTSSDDIKCTVCNRLFDSITALDLHMTKHRGEYSYSCNECGDGFEDKSELSEHRCILPPGAKSFSCVLCQKTFTRRWDLKRHIAVHTGLKQFPCAVCGESFARKYHQEQHLKMHRRSDAPLGTLICVFCSKVCRTEAALISHSRSHNPEGQSSDVSFECELCCVVFFDRQELHNHLEETHFKNKDYDCKDCGSKFQDFLVYQQHNCTEAAALTFKCPLCHKGFANKNNLIQHAAVHEDKKEFSCFACDKAFKRKHDLTRHLRIHSGEQPYACSTCGKCFQRSWNLRVHMQTHTGEKMYSCHDCQIEFINSDMFNRHMKSHQPAPHNATPNGEIAPVILAPVLNDGGEKMERSKPLSEDVIQKDDGCDVDDEMQDEDNESSRVSGEYSPVFEDKNVRDNNAEANDIRPSDTSKQEAATGKTFTCSECGQAFKKNSDLTRHLRIHTGERPYVCGVCGNSYKRVANLRTHMNIHTGNKPYRCSVCQRRFRGSGEHYRHMKTHVKETGYFKCHICSLSFRRVSALDEHNFETHFDLMNK